MFEKIIESSTETVKKTFEKGTEPIWNRLKNPFISSFTISWFLWNWKAIVFFVFSKQIVEYKLLYISRTFYDWGFGWDYGWIPILVKCFILPAVSAYLYIRCLPQLDNHFDRKNESAYHIKNQKILKDEKAGIERKAELDMEIANKENAIFNIKNQLSEGETVSSLKERIITLNDQVAALLIDNEKLVKDNIEQTYNLKSTYEEQINQLESSLNSQTIRLNQVTEDRERFRAEINNKSSEILNILNQMDVLRMERESSYDTIFAILTNIIENSHFISPQVMESVRKNVAESRIEDFFKNKIMESINHYTMGIFTYKVTLIHSAKNQEEVREYIEKLTKMFGGINIKIGNSTTTFDFIGSSDIDITSFNNLINESTFFEAVDITPYNI